jgi:serine protease inhibitor
MKNKNFFSISVLMIPALMLFSANSCDKPEVDPIQTEYKFQGDKKASELVNSGNEFGLDLFVKIAQDPECPDNMMMSPTSVAIALGMTYNGAENETKNAFEETLKLEGFSREEINEIYQALIEYLIGADPKVVFEIANSIWYRQNFPVLQSFIDVNKSSYFAEVTDLNFDSPTAVKTINDWVALKTRDKIKNVLDQIPSDAVMYLINALYFNGTWKFEFDPEKSFEGDFYGEDQSSMRVDYIKNQQTFNYFENDILSIVELPYGNGNFVMDILLPKYNKNLSDVYGQLNPENWQLWMNSLSPASGLMVQIPKFKYEYKTLLNKPLTDMGLGIAFSPGTADFSGINADKELYISRVIHKTFIDVNEKGTEAAAVTVVEVGVTSIGPDPQSFIANRPFIYVIREKNSDALLFMGKVEKPEYD